MTVASTSLVCRELRLRQFRNFAELELHFPEAGVAIIGDNGAGKTNLLEALYYLEIFRSFRGAPDEQLVKFGAEAFHLRATFVDVDTGETREISAGFEKKSRRKRVALNNAEPERLGDALGRIGIVIFSPSDVSMIAGAPGERRRFLDIVLSLNRPGYVTTLQRYRQILKQRNAMLRDGAPAQLLEAWDEGLVDAGARIIADRLEWTQQRAQSFASRYAAIGGGAGASLRYTSSVTGPDATPASDDIAASFRAQLKRLAGRERDRGVTMVGPHRDELEITFEDGDTELRDFGSGGQQRTAAIALRMIEADTIREARGREPMVLLDDVFAELDPGRSKRILELLETEERGQVVLTAPKESDLEVRRGSLVHWSIAKGQVKG